MKFGDGMSTFDQLAPVAFGDVPEPPDEEEDEADEGPFDLDLEGSTKAGLMEYAESIGVQVNERMTKAEILDAIEENTYDDEIDFDEDFEDE